MLYKSRVIHTYKYNYNNLLTCRAYKLKKNQNRYKLKRIKSIQFRDCNNITMKNFLLKSNNIQHYISPQIHNYNFYAKKLIEAFKLSGYISSIQICKSPDSTYTTMSLRLNPIVKKITVLNQKNLQIPSKLLKRLLKKQIGMPKNYKLINNHLKTIYLWYKSKGFTWMNVELIEEELSNNIKIQITEGKISYSKLTCLTCNQSNKKILHLLEALIKKELQIYPGDILNIKILEAGIRRLTGFNLISDCNYVIKRKKQGLIILIKYSIIESHATYFYKHNSTLQNYSNYKKIFRLFKQNMYIFNFSNKYFLFFQKLNIYSSIISIEQYFGLKCKSIYSINNIKNISLDFRMKKSYSELNIEFFHPYINKQKKFLGHLIVGLYNKINASRLFCPYFLIQFHKINEKQISNLSNHSYNIYFRLEHNILKNINILEKAWNSYTQYNKLNIQVTHYKISQLICKHSILKTTIFKMNTFSKNIKNNLVSLQISITHNTIYVWDQLKAGILLKIYSKLFAFIDKKRNNNLYRLRYLGQNIGLKYIHVFNLPQIFDYMYDHTIIVISEFYFLLNSQKYRPILPQSYSHVDNLHFTDKDSTIFPLYSFYLLNIEYHLSKFQYCSMYCFWNYITYLHSQTQHKPVIKTMKSIHIDETYLGLGIKVYIPISKMPNISLEYSTNSKCEHFFGLRTDSKYNE